MMGWSYREECNEAKLAREGIIEQKPVSGKSKRAKPIVLQYRYAEGSMFGWLYRTRKEPKKWRKWGLYRTVEEARKVAGDQRRKHQIWEFQVLDENGEVIKGEE